MKPKNDLSFDDLATRYRYNPEDGTFTRLVSGHGKHAGEIAGTVAANGYCFVMVKGRQYLAHRLAWLYVNGAFPEGDIDHINGDKRDNRISNLREATRSQNMCNRRAKPNSRSGIKGVHWHPQARRWRSAIAINGKSKHLGYFDTIDEARDAYAAAAQAVHGDFARLI